MSTFDLRRLLVASTVGGACLAMIAKPSDPALSSLAVHPIWAIAIILAAHHGARALLVLPALSFGLVAATTITGAGAESALARIQRPGDLAMWCVAIAVAFVGGAHQRRVHSLRERLATAEERARTADEATRELSDTALALRDRCDRSDTSLVFLADVATRLDMRDPSDAGQAALELAMTRTGAGGALVQLLEPNGRLRTLTARGRWSAETFWPPELFRDRTAAVAVECTRPVVAHEVPGVTSDDSDIAAPLIAPNGKTIGVLALRRVPFQQLTRAMREDLSAVARWVAAPLARSLDSAASQPIGRRPAPASARASRDDA